jgi:flagellar biosynthesis/type III secretory pathway protein FliH
VVSIRVSADNLAIVRTWVAQAQAPIGLLAVMEDASLSRTCCVVETPTGVVRGTLASQLAAMRQALLDAANLPLQTLITQWTAAS